MSNSAGNIRLIRQNAVDEKTKAVNDQWHRRLAIQLAGQLPENRNDAIRVLNHTRGLVDNFLNGPANDEPDKDKERA